MIDLSEWEDDLAKLQVTQAPHRLGGRVIWIATRTADGGDVKAPLTVAA